MAPASGERRAASGNHGRTPGIFKSPSEAPGDNNTVVSCYPELKQKLKNIKKCQECYLLMEKNKK
jgi:hypothetical protein